MINFRRDGTNFRTSSLLADGISKTDRGYQIVIGQHNIALQQNILTGGMGLNQFFRTGPKIHDYTQHHTDLDYVIEPAEYPNQCYMTGQGKRIRPGDRILLRQNQRPQAYTVKQIDYYANPSSMWIALLEKYQGTTT